jgi:hypothetical protein
MAVFLGGRWPALAPGDYVWRIGGLIIARGRDAADVTFGTAIGFASLASLEGWTFQVRHERNLRLRLK